jgi:dolichol kinase
LAFKKKMQPAYQALAQELREQSIHVPSLRPTNYARNAFHLTSATVAVLCIELLPWSVVIGIAVAWAAFAWSCEISRRVSPKMNALLMRLFEKVAHPHEAIRVNSATWYATALLVLSLTHSPLICMAAVAVLGVGDPMAAVIGKRFGKIRLVNGRSLEGSLAFVVSSAAVVFGLLRIFHPGIAVGAAVLLASIVALAGAIAELLTHRLDDNLTIPLAVGAGAGLSAWLLAVPML